MRYPTLVLFIALLVSAAAPGAFAQDSGQISKVLTVQFTGPSSLSLNLPEGYTVQTRPGIDGNIIFAPYQEYFLVGSNSFDLSAPVTDEAGLQRELDAFAAKNSELVFSNKKVWTDPTGPRATFEHHQKVGKKKIAITNLAYPMGDELVIFTLTGDETSLADQRVVQNLYLKKINE